MASNYFNAGDQIKIIVRALDASGNIISEAKEITFNIAKEYISTSPEKIWGTSQNSSVNVEWCGISDATKYTINYGSLETNLDLNIANIDASNLSQTINTTVDNTLL